MLLWTVVILILLTVISYTLFDRDLFAPPTVVSLGLLFATLCAYYNEETWDLDFSSETTKIIVWGIAFFIIGGLIAVLIDGFSRPGKFGFSHKKSPVRFIRVRTWKTALIIMFQVGTIIMLVLEMRRITGGSSWSQIVSTFRAQEANVDPDEHVMKLSSICRMCIDFSFAAALIYSYIVGNNLAVRAKQTISNWVPVILSSIMAFLQGYRSDMLRYWIAILVVTYISKKRKSGWTHNAETKKMIKKMAVSLLIIAILFVALRGTVGRKETDWDPLYYLTFYAGSSIAALDMFVKDPLPPSEIWGKETFYYLNQSISAWLKTFDRYIFYKEFRRSPNGTFIGNIYTALRPPYYDFGFSGMLVYMAVMGFFFTFFYSKVRSRHGKKQIDFSLLLYSYIAYTFFLYFYNLYNTFIALAMVRTILRLIIINLFLFGFKKNKESYIEIQQIAVG